MNTTLRSDEIACSSCVSKIEKALSGTAGVEDVEVHLNTGRIEVAYDEATIGEDALVELVEEAGYQAEVSPL